MKEQLQQIALRIQELRDIFGYTAQDVAAKLNVELAQYEQYERSGTDVPISVLYQLASLYNVDMTELLSGQSARLDTLSFVQNGEGLVVDRFKGYAYENIGYKFMHRKMEPMIVTLNPTKTRPVPVTHTGQEINYCLEGEMIVDYDGREVWMKPGDCVYFDPTHPHGQRAAGDKPAKFLTIIHE